MKQREAVFKSVVEVIGEPNGTVIKPTTEQKKEMNGMIVDLINEGECDFSPEAHAKYADDKAKTSYVNGLISNWVRKDPMLNGGTKYVPANPGSRSGQGDKQVKALRALLSTHKGTEHEAEITTALDKRLGEITASKVKEIVIDDLPEELKKLA